MDTSIGILCQIFIEMAFFFSKNLNAKRAQFENGSQHKMSLSGALLIHSTAGIPKIFAIWKPWYYCVSPLNTINWIALTLDVLDVPFGLSGIAWESSVGKHANWIKRVGVFNMGKLQPLTQK